MKIFDAIFLGMIQGLTEFLPISSSGHLAIFQKFFYIEEKIRLPFTVFTHLATLLALLCFFTSEIRSEIRNRNFPLLLKILYGTIPVAGFGYLFKNRIEDIFHNPKLIPYFFILTGILLFLTKFFVGNRKTIGFKDALIIGCFQVFGLLPGVSRSGVTITGALFLNIAPEESFRFSFLLSIPAIIGANIQEFPDLTKFALKPIFLLSFLSAFIFGLLALYLLKKILIKRRFYYFSLYLFILGILLITYL